MKATKQQIVALFYLALSLLWIVPFVTLVIRNGVLMTPNAGSSTPLAITPTASIPLKKLSNAVRKWLNACSPKDGSSW